jgi:probable addiction module antidote protein
MNLPQAGDTLTQFPEAPAASQPPVAHLDAALERNDMPALMSALRQIVKERGGFEAVAQRTGLNRTALYNIVSARHDPRLSTILRLLPGLGLRFSLKRTEKRYRLYNRVKSQRRRKA